MLPAAARWRRCALPACLGVLLLAAVLVAVPSLGGAPARASAATSGLPRGQLTTFEFTGPNPTDVTALAYVPASLAPEPGLVVVNHACTWDAERTFEQMRGELVPLAEEHGFVVVLTQSPRASGCWDVASPAGLTRDGGSDPEGVVSATREAQRMFGVTPARTTTLGVSSGAMLVSVLLAEYPDVFAAGSALMGAPAGCFATDDPSLWNPPCLDGEIDHTPQEWARIARAMGGGLAPDGDTAVPRLQMWHATDDPVLSVHNLHEGVEQWTALHGLGPDPALISDADRVPVLTWNRTRYGGGGDQPPVESVEIERGGHSLPFAYMVTYALRFLGLEEGRAAPTGEPTTSTAPVSEAPTSEAPTSEAPTTEAPTTGAPTTGAPTTGAPTTGAPTTSATTPSTTPSTTSAPPAPAASEPVLRGLSAVTAATRLSVTLADADGSTRDLGPSRLWVGAISGPGARVTPGVPATVDLGGLPDGRHTVTVDAVTSSGVVRLQQVVLLDRTAPRLSPRPPGRVLLGQPVRIDPRAVDAGIGLATATCDAVDTRRLGAVTVRCRALDAIGHSAATTLSVVVEARSGLSVPRGARVRAGQAVGVRLGDVAGRGVSDAQAAALVRGCGLRVLVLRGSTGGAVCLRYDARADRFVGRLPGVRMRSGSAALVLRVAYPGRVVRQVTVPVRWAR